MIKRYKSRVDTRKFYRTNERIFASTLRVLDTDGKQIGVLSKFEALQKEVLREPRIALDGGEDGLDFYRNIFKQAPRYLKDGGYCIIEIGFGQLDAVKEILSGIKGFNLLEVKKDQYGIDRGIIARWIN